MIHDHQTRIFERDYQITLRYIHNEKVSVMAEEYKVSKNTVFGAVKKFIYRAARKVEIPQHILEEAIIRPRESFAIIPYLEKYYSIKKQKLEDAVHKRLKNIYKVDEITILRRTDILKIIESIEYKIKLIEKSLEKDLNILKNKISYLKEIYDGMEL